MCFFALSTSANHLVLHSRPWFHSSFVFDVAKFCSMSIFNRRKVTTHTMSRCSRVLQEYDWCGDLQLSFVSLIQFLSSRRLAFVGGCLTMSCLPSPSRIISQNSTCLMVWLSLIPCATMCITQELSLWERCAWGRCYFALVNCVHLPRNQVAFTETPLISYHVILVCFHQPRCCLLAKDPCIWL